MTERGIDIETGKVPSPEKLSKMLVSSQRQVNQLIHLVDDLLKVVQIRAEESSHLPELN